MHEETSTILEESLLEKANRIVVWSDNIVFRSKMTLRGSTMNLNLKKLTLFSYEVARLRAKEKSGIAKFAYAGAMFTINFKERTLKLELGEDIHSKLKDSKKPPNEVLTEVQKILADKNLKFEP